MELHDLQGERLRLLSAAQHEYFGGNTLIQGTITIEGAQEDELETLELEVLQDGSVVAVAHLSSDAEAMLLHRRFGEAKKVEIPGSVLLFKRASAQAARVNGADDGALMLRVIDISDE